MLSSAQPMFSEKNDFPVGGTAESIRNLPTGTKDPLWYLLAVRLGHMRTRCGLPATRLGELSHLSLTLVGSIEDGRQTPKIHTIEQIACALGISPSWLAFGHEGFEPFRQRRPRDLVPPEPPEPCAEARQPTQRYKDVGYRCRRIRQVRGQTLREAAASARITHAALHLIEKGSTIPLVSTCEQLAVAFGVAPAWLTYGEGLVPEGIEPARDSTTPI